MLSVHIKYQPVNKLNFICLKRHVLYIKIWNRVKQKVTEFISKQV